MSLHQIDKTSFRRAQCRGQLSACEMVWTTSGRAWVRDSKVIGTEVTSIFGITSYYIEGNA
jgi:hypothetical protein